ncbi:tyrosine-type recombinase/integrase [Ktedonosporobacter rubrisoli]|uniref:tyrosine-type recombinase/integrase n=1 Tax=Ktedonosporobacter rubrisoli TaxID=2509675 RepID=UPI0030F3ED70
MKGLHNCLRRHVQYRGKLLRNLSPAFRDRQEEEQRRAGQGWQEQNLIFCTRKGTPLTANHLLYQHFRQLLVKAGLPEVTFHDLRHSVATMLLA